MPILNVSVVLKDGENLADGTANMLADEAGRIFSSLPAQTWLRLTLIEAENYAENEVRPEVAPSPVFVEVLKYSNPSVDERVSECLEIASKFSSILDRPKENIHIIYLPEGKGRVAFGGILQ